jgi:alkanesulfonate monooxygenase SsuD/methylene tetrahydromethanopterin reductase-like flavin-dependent oxidoreductase (luciferase family)
VAGRARYRHRGRYRLDAGALRRNVIFGPPRRVIEQLGELIAQTPATEIALGMQQPGLDPKLAMRFLKRFSTEVLPVLRQG